MMNENSPIKSVAWKGQVEFEGSPEDFEKFAVALNQSGVHVSVDKESIFADLIKRGYVAPVRWDMINVAKQLNESNSLLMRKPAIGDIAGGIRTPHLHVGDDIVLVDREHFKSLLGQVARDIFEQRVTNKQDFDEIVAPLVAAER
jgi:hypothetical protein